MFLNVHLTQGRSDISLLLQPLSFSPCWLILATLFYLTLEYFVFCFHTSPFCTILCSNFHHLINSPNLLALLNVFEYLFFIAKPHCHPAFNENQKKGTNEVQPQTVWPQCVMWWPGCHQISCDLADGQDGPGGRAPARLHLAAGINRLLSCRIWNLFLNSLYRKLK